MIKKIRTIAQTFTGYSFRNPGMIKSSGAIGVCQMKDLEDQEYVLKNLQGYTDLMEIGQKHLLRPTDLLFVSRGQRSYAVRVAVEHPESIVASAAFIVVRPDLEKVNPDYLTWYINQQEAQAWFKARMQRSTVQAVAISELQDLPVPLPGLSEQAVIGRLGTLALSEYMLSIQLAQKEYELLNSHIRKFVTQSYS